MNEVAKLYENAGVEPINFAKQGAIDFTNTIEIDGKRYPDFTAEKQLELIKWLVQNSYRNYFTIDYSFDKKLWRCKCNLSDSDYEFIFEESLASLINSLWQDLTEEEKQEIKEILV